MVQKRIEPHGDQESVWDYPRPPRVEDSRKLIQIVFNGIVLVDTQKAKRILETSHPPVYYIPPEDISMEYLQPTVHQTYCEWKGMAAYYTITVKDRNIQNGAWYYPKPTKGYEEITNYVAFYPAKMDACYVNGEKIIPQEGDFYGGWITKDIVGPFKGGRNTSGW